MAQQVVELTSNEAALLRGMQRVIDQQAKLQGGFKKTGEEAKKAGKETEGSFSAGLKSSLDDIGGMVTGFLSVGTAIKVATAALENFNAIKAQSAKDLQASEFKQAMLIQVAEGNTKQERTADFQRLKAKSEDLFARGVGRNVDEAASALFDLQSAGVGNEIDTFADLASTGAGGDAKEVAEMAKGVAAVIAQLGKAETGSARSVVNKGFAGAKIAPGSAKDLLVAAAKAGGSARSLQISDEELIAATAFVGQSIGSTDVAGTQVAGLLKALDKDGNFAGKKLDDSIAEIDAMKLSGAQLYELLGTQEAVSAYRTLSGGRTGYKSALADVEQAQSNDSTGEMVDIVANTGDLAASRNERLATANEELSRRETGRGLSKLEADATLKNWEAHERRRLQDSGYSPFGVESYIWSRKAAINADRTLHGDEAFLKHGFAGAQSREWAFGIEQATPESTAYINQFRPGGALAPKDSVATQIPGVDSQEKYQKRIAEAAERTAATNEAMARGGNGNAAANAQAGRHIE